MDGAAQPLSMSPCLKLGDTTRLSVTEPRRKRRIAAAAASFIQVLLPVLVWELNWGVCVHTHECVCFTKYSFVSLVTPEDHTNVFSTSCHSSPFSQ